MSWRKSIFLIFTLSLLPTFIFSPAHAGYNYTYCVWDDQLGCKQVIDCDPGCVPPNLNCPNYRKPDTCGGSGTTPCNCQGPETTLGCSWSPSQAGGICRRTGGCGSGYVPSPADDPCFAVDIDQAFCEAKNPGTCVQAEIPQPTPSPAPPSPSTCDGGKGIPTAIGCINVESPTEFVKSILGLAIGIGGGIAFLLMLFGAFQIMTSQGDPERLKAGKELIGSALAGLLMIIFSVFLLQLIGFQILQIPGLTK